MSVLGNPVQPLGAVPRAMIRGSLFQSMPLFVKEHFGAARWPEFLQHLDPASAEVMSGGMNALGWYPFMVVASTTDAVRAMGGSEETLRLFAAHNLDRATNMIFRAIFKVGSPEFMLSKSDQVWKKYYSSGRMTVPHVSKGSGTVRLYDFPEMTRSYTRMVLYGIEAVILKAGGKTTSSEVTSDICEGDAFTEFAFTWHM